MGGQEGARLVLGPATGGVGTAGVQSTDEASGPGWDRKSSLDSCPATEEAPVGVAECPTPTSKPERLRAVLWAPWAQ